MKIIHKIDVSMIFGLIIFSMFLANIVNIQFFNLNTEKEGFCCDEKPKSVSQFFRNYDKDINLTTYEENAQHIQRVNNSSFAIIRTLNQKANLSLSAYSASLNWNNSYSVNIEYIDAVTGDQVPDSTVNVISPTVMKPTFIQLSTSRWILSLNRFWSFYVNPGYYYFNITVSSPTHEFRTTLLNITRNEASGIPPQINIFSPVNTNNKYAFDNFPFNMSLTDDIALRPMTVFVNNTKVFFLDFTAYFTETNAGAALIGPKIFKTLIKAFVFPLPEDFKTILRTQKDSNIFLSISGEDVDGLTFNISERYFFTNHKPSINISKVTSGEYYNPPITIGFSLTDLESMLQSITIKVERKPEFSPNSPSDTETLLSLTDINTHTYDTSLEISLPKTDPSISLVIIIVEVTAVNTYGGEAFQQVYFDFHNPDASIPIVTSIPSELLNSISSTSSVDNNSNSKGISLGFSNAFTMIVWFLPLLIFKSLKTRKSIKKGKE